MPHWSSTRHHLTQLNTMLVVGLVRQPSDTLAQPHGMLV
jgi:hypothetical protein